MATYGDEYQVSRRTVIDNSTELDFGRLVALNNDGKIDQTLLPTGIKAGSEWLAGSEVPGNDIGDNGDYYLNMATSDVFTKTNDSWGTAICNLKGADGVPGANGADGARGATWYHGNDVPATLTGFENDYYLNTSNDIIYQRGEAEWSEIGSFRGQKGDTGAKGDKGDPGLTGQGGTIANDYDSNAAYGAHQLVVYNGELYRRLTAGSETAWDATKWYKLTRNVPIQLRAKISSPVSYRDTTAINFSNVVEDTHGMLDTTYQNIITIMENGVYTISAMCEAGSHCYSGFQLSDFSPSQLWIKNGWSSVMMHITKYFNAGDTIKVILQSPDGNFYSASSGEITVVKISD